MSAGQTGYFVGAFLIGLFIFAVFLIIFRLIPPLRRRPAVSYGVSGLLGVGALVLSSLSSGAVAENLTAAVLLAALVYWGYSRTSRTDAKQ